MKLSPLILTLASATAVGTYVAMKSLSVPPSNPFPLIVPDPADKSHFTVQWPDESIRTNYTWSAQTSTDMTQWREAYPFPVDGTNWFIERTSRNLFIRLKGVTNSQPETPKLETF